MLAKRPRTWTFSSKTAQLKIVMKIITLSLVVLATLNGQDFSVEGLINDLHMEPEEKRLPTDKWTRIHHHAKDRLRVKRDSLRDTGQYYGNQEISIPFPDSLANEFFRIKKGQQVTQIYDGTITGRDTIIGFEMVWPPVGEAAAYYFQLGHLENRHRPEPGFSDSKYFYVIGDFDVKPIPTLFERDEKGYLLLDRITYTLTQKLESSRKFNKYMMTFPQIDTIDSLKSSLLEYCDIRHTSLDLDGDTKPDTLIQVEPKEGVRPPAAGWYFSAVLFSSVKTGFLMPFSVIDSVTEVNGNKYLMLRLYGPETGARVLGLFYFDQEKKEMIWVFGELYWTT